MSNPPHPPSSTDPVTSRVQQSLGAAYAIERELGGGGMSRVFVARDRGLAREVVVKVLREDIAEGMSRERFRREILMSANLQHPNIVGVIGAGDADGLPYFVMPFVEGESLRARLAVRGALSVANTVSIMRDVARALAFAHARGVVHRDIKPDNVLLAGGAAIVADFGVAKAVERARVRREHPHGTLTRDGVSLGTPAYMAPEQVAGDPSTDHRADLYALGVMVYEMLVGQPPFAGKGVTATMQAHLIEAPQSVAALRPSTPAALAGLVMRCLAKDPGARPQDAAEILAALDDPAVVSGAQSSTGSAASAPPALRAPSLARWIAGAAVLVAATVAVVGTRSWGSATGAPAAAGASAPALPAGVGVLPLVSVSPDSGDAYLALGMTDEITSALSRVPGLRVSSRLAAAAAQEAGGTVGEVAQRLGVPFLLEGTVQRVEDRIRVAVRLVDASDGFSAWSEVYERPTDDLLAVQADIASQIASAVRRDVAVEGAADSMIDVAGARDPEAYNLYLRGHWLLTRGGPAVVAEAVAVLDEAVERDPAFARAQVELSEAYIALPATTDTDRAAALDRAIFAAQRAVALDPMLADAHAALGAAHHLQWRWQEARATLARALAIDSSDVAALRWLSLSDLVNGDAVSARRHLTRLANRTGGSGGAAGLRALAFVLTGDPAGALQVAREAWARDSTATGGGLVLANTLLQLGRPAEAVPVLEGLQQDTSSPSVLGSLGYALARAGRDADARAVLRTLEADTRRPGAYPAMARVFLGLGEPDRAIDALTWATAARDEAFALESMASPVYDALRDDPRFARVVEIVGLDVRRLTTPRARRPA